MLKRADVSMRVDVEELKKSNFSNLLASFPCSKEKNLNLSCHFAMLSIKTSCGRLGGSLRMTTVRLPNHKELEKYLLLIYIMGYYNMDNLFAFAFLASSSSRNLVGEKVASLESRISYLIIFGFNISR